MDLIGIYYNKLSRHKDMFDSSYNDLSRTVQDVDQLNGRMPVGGKIGPPVTVVMNGNTGIFKIIEMLINGLFHI